jgi:hypothetical protein
MSWETFSSFTPQTWRSRAIARETLLEKLRFRYFSAGFVSVYACSSFVSVYACSSFVSVYACSSFASVYACSSFASVYACSSFASVYERLSRVRAKGVVNQDYRECEQKAL